MALSWIAVDAWTGRVIDDLPDLTMQSPVRQTIGQYESNVASIPLTTTADWLTATRPYATALIGVDENNLPAWGGYVTQRPRTEQDTLLLPLVTGEGYFTRRFISPLVSDNVIIDPSYGYYAAVDQCALGADLVARYAQDGTKPGIPVRIVTGTSAQPGRTHIYSDADNQKVYDGLQGLSGILHGPEWTVTWEWQHNPERITPVFTIADRLGVSPLPGLLPNASFEMPGSALSFNYLEDYTEGHGANDVTAYGSGQGNSRPSARVVSQDFQGRPTIEYRFPVTTVGELTIAQIQALTDYANQALIYLGDGMKTLTLTANIDDAQVFGQDWNIGDDIGFTLGGLDADGVDTVPAFPGGFSGTARAIGVERTDTTIAPIIYVPNPTLTAGAF